MPMRHSPLFRRIAKRLAHYANHLRPEWRLARSAQWQAHPALLQPWTFTRPNRHPEFFAVVQRQLQNEPEPRILSFGCSTGEEAFALAETLSAARIDGIDINPACIAKAKRRLSRQRQDRISFECRETVPDSAAIYDAIFCLSVLRHARLDDERPETCLDILPFARFAGVVRDMDHALKPDGFLIIWGSNFRFSDTANSAHYRPMPVEGKKPERGAYYGPDDKLLAVSENDQWVFQKLAPAP